MTNVIAFKKPKRSQQHKGKFLCQQGHHRWKVDQQQHFHSKQGKLLTLYRCQRCGITKTKAL